MAVGAASGVLALALTGAATLIGGPDRPDVALVAAEPIPAPIVVATPTPQSVPAACSTAAGPFVPTSISVPGVGRQIAVLPLPRDLNGVPGVPPLNTLGKATMAFDLGSGIRPGSPRGNALLNAHTWPDGSALGNKLLGALEKGDRLVARGPLGTLCYRVTDRVEVPLDDPGTRYYAKAGEPQLAIVVCSGRRTGPGQWTHRTIWYATPIT